jgi:hypothetical protein
VVARVKQTPTHKPRQRAGRHGSLWITPAQDHYRLVTAELLPGEAQKLASEGAYVVFDACGCGGDQCELDWVSAEDVCRMAAAGPPRLHPSHNGRADLEHWRSDDGKDLIVAAVEVSWADRIPG